jgi:hypothetical protein
MTAAERGERHANQRRRRTSVGTPGRGAARTVRWDPNLEEDWPGEDQRRLLDVLEQPERHRDTDEVVEPYVALTTRCQRELIEGLRLPAPRRPVTVPVVSASSSASGHRRRHSLFDCFPAMGVRLVGLVVVPAESGGFWNPFHSDVLAVLTRPGKRGASGRRTESVRAEAALRRALVPDADRGVRSGGVTPPLTTCSAE